MEAAGGRQQHGSNTAAGGRSSRWGRAGGGVPHRACHPAATSSRIPTRGFFPELKNIPQNKTIKWLKSKQKPAALLGQPLKVQSAIPSN
jgi:hypothetical protein